MTTAEHRYFGTGATQGFHTDGTLDPIGLVATSLLWFERAAPEGGHTTIFQAVEAFEHLRRGNPGGAATLMCEDALTRVATSFHPPQRVTGPAFADLGNGLRARWADDGNEIWQLAGDLGAQRAAMVEQMRQRSQPGSPYRLDIAIPSRTGVVLRNGRVAHGRTAFVAGPGERILIRGLYTTELS
ncbi:TauD/TfdA family dioxygenase [Nocardia sp. NBC_00403]|uniref:TauD/TfdA family dioxygenase n=1 Tax=Nocardia sp. NBC_00403 TaxID=2975990 RepID=UPI002E1C8ED3